MTRDSAAVVTLDDRRRCPMTAASNVTDDVSAIMKDHTTTSSSNSNVYVCVGDGGSSPKSSSAVSTTTSCCGGSSSSSRSGSDDDESAAVARPSTVIDGSYPTTMGISPIPSIHTNIMDGNNDEKDSSISRNSDDALPIGTPTSIGGRLTFYKDGKFIFQLAAHQQQNPYDNQSSIPSPCRWIPVPTVIQHHKNNVKRIGEWSQHQQNKTIWPYLAPNLASENKSPQPPIVKLSERKPLHYQLETTPPPLPSYTGTVNNVAPISSVVVAATTNIARKPSRKCSTTISIENITDLQHQHWQPLTQLRCLTRRSQQHQHQSFIMVATKAIKAQRRLLALPKKQRHGGRRTKTVTVKESLVLEQQQTPLNLECIVRNLWCRRHTTELLLRRQLSLNSNVDATTAIATVDTFPPAFRHVAATTCVVDSAGLNTTGGGKRRSVICPLSTKSSTIPVNAITMTTGSMSITSNSSGNSPHKKYRSGQQQQRRAVVDNSIIKGALPSPPVVPTNDHSISAILSGGMVGTKRVGNSVTITVVDPESCAVTSSTTSVVVTPQKNPAPLTAPLSLLRTLLKSPSGECGSSLTVMNPNNGGYKQNHTTGSRKRSAIESTTVAPTLLSPMVSAAVATADVNDLRASTIPLQSISTGAVNDSTATLTALHQLPTLHHPAAAAAAGYFNVLYHQAAMAAAMAYQTHAQLPQTLPKPQPLPKPTPLPKPQPLPNSHLPPLMSSQFPTTGGANNSWQHQLNRRTLLPPPKVVGENGMTAAPTTVSSSSASTIVTPYSSPLIAAAVNGSGLLPPATPSPPPLLLHSPSVHHQNVLFHHQQQHQQYQLQPSVQQPLSYNQQQNQQQQGSSVKKRTLATTDAAMYKGNLDGNSMPVVTSLLDEESSSSADCMPLNLSKDCVAETVGGTNTAATVR